MPLLAAAAPVLALAFAGLSAWLLRRAFTRREIVGQYGSVYAQADAPIRFWLTVAVNLMTPLVFAAFGVALIYRALVPAPLSERAARYYPKAAVARSLTGFVMLRCTVTPKYRVSDCRVMSETPAGVGFGASALKVAALLTLPEKDRATSPPGKVINLPIRYQLPAKGR